MSEPDEPSIAEMRESYELRTLRRKELAENPFDQFHAWFQEARDQQLTEANAMTLGTLGLDNIPTTRTVLLKDLDQRGFTFFTNYQSRKAREIVAHPAASLTFLWKELERQVIVRGRVEKVSIGESETYFNSRPYDSRIGAWASMQSETIENRDWLIQRDSEIRQKYPDTGKPDCVPIPDFWGGYRVLPLSIEFWQGGPGRLHDRFEYSRAEVNDGSDWKVIRLSP